MVLRRIVRVEVPAEDVEVAADALWRGDPSAVSETDAGDGRVVLTADVVDPSMLAGLRSSWVLSVADVDDEEHLDAWRDWAQPQRAGRHLVVQPAWLPAGELEPDDVVVVLDPGRAFGSGAHPSTRLALAAVEAALRGGERVLDVGCGSGVLSVAAARLGAATIDAIDVDPAAIASTVANAARNGVADRVRASLTPLDEVEGTFDLTVANIGLRVLVDGAAALSSATRPGGVLIVSGLLEDQVRAVVSSVGFVEEDRRVEDGWVAAVLRAPSGEPSP